MRLVDDRLVVLGSNCSQFVYRICVELRRTARQPTILKGRGTGTNWKLGSKSTVQSGEKG